MNIENKYKKNLTKSKVILLNAPKASIKKLSDQKFNEILHDNFFIFEVEDYSDDEKSLPPPVCVSDKEKYNYIF